MHSSVLTSFALFPNAPYPPLAQNLLWLLQYPSGRIRHLPLWIWTSSRVSHGAQQQYICSSWKKNWRQRHYMWPILQGQSSAAIWYHAKYHVIIGKGRVLPCGVLSHSREGFVGTCVVQSKDEDGISKFHHQDQALPDSIGSSPATDTASEVRGILPPWSADNVTL